MIDWRHWHNEPHLVGGLILLGWLYALCTGPLRRRIAPRAAYPRAHAIRFYAGLVIFYLAVGSPLDQIGERFLLSAHMVQHLLIIYPAAILLLTGLPDWLVEPVTGRPGLRLPLRVLTHPLACTVIYTLTISLWHVPVMYDWALQNRIVHIIEHLMFFGAALFYWWPILSKDRRFPALHPARQILYLTGITITMTPLFAFIAFSDSVLYPTYEYAPRLFAGLSPSQDQLLGAAIMKLGSMGITLIVIAWAFYRWYTDTERSAPSLAPRPSHPAILRRTPQKPLTPSPDTHR
ncbi:putative membrane protein [Opitutaceae bacterium TAV1]|nr:putative membrane protein [Opitutaceae bacterium TAV1]